MPTFQQVDVNVEKYKAVQVFPMQEDRNQEDRKLFGDFISLN